MNVLGIETSCDETSAAVVVNGVKVLSNVVASSLSFHKKYGGIVPEIAFRKQLETVAVVTEEALAQAKIVKKHLDAVCVTQGPGLLGSLLVGISFAKALAASLRIPLLGVNHLHSHMYSVFLQHRRIPKPFVALIVSGGHTSLFFVKDFHAISLLGSTQDDACGEAFDKVAKILRLGYPGGPEIERAAQRGDRRKIKFSCSGTNEPLNFSFSGIKTAVLYYVQKESSRRRLTTEHVADIAASFQESVIEALIKKSLLACVSKRTHRLVLGGGVVANNRLRENFTAQARQEKIEVYLPDKKFCLDNAAMVAGFGYRLLQKGQRSDLYLAAIPS